MTSPHKTHWAEQRRNSQLSHTELDDPGDSCITHYVILRRNPSTHQAGEFSVLNTNMGSNSTSYTNNTVEPETRYGYKIKAVNARGESVQSNFTPPDTREAPPLTPEPTQAPTAGTHSTASPPGTRRQ